MSDFLHGALSHHECSAICRVPTSIDPHPPLQPAAATHTHTNVDIEPNTVTALLPQAETSVT